MLVNMHFRAYNNTMKSCEEVKKKIKLLGNNKIYLNFVYICKNE